jgi:hypothetical protein
MLVYVRPSNEALLRVRVPRAEGRPGYPAPFSASWLGLFDRFVGQLPIALWLEGHYGLTFCLIAHEGARVKEVRSSLDFPTLWLR